MFSKRRCLAATPLTEKRRSRAQPVFAQPIMGARGRRFPRRSRPALVGVNQQRREHLKRQKGERRPAVAPQNYLSPNVVRRSIVFRASNHLASSLPFARFVGIAARLDRQHVQCIGVDLEDHPPVADTESKARPVLQGPDPKTGARWICRDGRNPVSNLTRDLGLHSSKNPQGSTPVGDLQHRRFIANRYRGVKFPAGFSKNYSVMLQFRADTGDRNPGNRSLQGAP